jgi:hypothetical protein
LSLQCCHQIEHKKKSSKFLDTSLKLTLYEIES